MDKMILIDRCVTNNNGCSISMFETIGNSTGRHVVCACNRGDVDAILFQSDDIDEAINYYRGTIDAYNRIMNMQHEIINRDRKLKTSSATSPSLCSFTEDYDTYGISHED
ncbi:MAG: hypothetical protein RR744_07915 [Cellulosilyticaceae bacterium]